MSTPRPCSQAQHLGVFGNCVDPHALADIVEKHVAGLHNRGVQIHHAVALFPVHPAFVHLSVKNAVARAERGEIF